MDANGRSDPYCVLGLASSSGAFIKDELRKKTPVQYKTLKPQWEKDNRFVFDPFHKGELCSIRIDVWDEDKISSDDFMGQIFLDPMVHYKLDEELFVWLPLQSRKGKKDKVAGDIYLHIITTEI